MTTVLLMLLSLAHGQPTPEPESATSLLAQDGAQLTVVVSGLSRFQPGDSVGVYVWEQRPDPRTHSLRSGSRYAGDARVLWTGGDLVIIALSHTPTGLMLDRPIHLGPARNAQPTTAWTPPAPPTPEPEPEPETETGVSIAHQSARPYPMDQPAPPSAIGQSRADRYDGRRQQLSASMDWSDDGFQTGVGVGELTWSMWPEKRVGAVHLSLEGLRSMRWVSPDNPSKKEPWARAAAAGYWLWTRVETPGVELAFVGGLAIGVDTNGPASALSLGLRLGATHSGHVLLDWEQYGALGYRGTVLGMVPLSRRLRAGLRARAGALPLHEPPIVISILPLDPWRQLRADGSLHLSYDLSDTLSLTGGAGLAGYDLIAADAGPVLDGALEIRW